MDTQYFEEKNTRALELRFGIIKTIIRCIIIEFLKNKLNTKIFYFGPHLSLLVVNRIANI